MDGQLQLEQNAPRWSIGGMTLHPSLAASLLSRVDVSALSTLALVWSLFVTWMIVDCALNEESEGKLNLIWLLIIIFAPFGSFIYFFTRKLSRSSRIGVSERRGPNPLLRGAPDIRRELLPDEPTGARTTV